MQTNDTNERKKTDNYTNYCQPMTDFPTNYGWICPRCGAVNAPHITQCPCAGWQPPQYPPVGPWVYEQPAPITWYTTNTDDGTGSGEFHNA